ncbi:Ig-like domain repeat protein [Streptomyces graminofaciens]|uniref:Ig-like domain repeat protein n=1 Tax=Streptomyces graminofaciens TaxID=68212 RepID=UPI00257475F4|nr:Ig-like domain repeat protein [Streptomyces graminofaciens]
MRVRALPAATALAVLFGSAALAVGTAAPAVADTSTPLPVQSSGDIVVDGVHQRVFVSDPTGGQVVATDYAGKVVGSVPSLPGAKGLELSPDSGTLYAAVPGDDAIVAIDTATVTEAERYPTGEGTDPQYPAWAGGKLWFGYGGAAQGNLGSLDVSGADPVVTLKQDGGWYAAPTLTSTPGAPNTLAAGIEGVSPISVAVYDVSSGTAKRTASGPNTDEYTASNLRDLALTPDGSHLVVASGAPYFHQVYRTSDLTPDGKYPTDSYPNAVEIAPDGTVAAGIDGAYSPDVWVYEPGAATAEHIYDFTNTADGTGAGSLAAGALAWAPDESHLFAVVALGTGGYALRDLNDVVQSPTSLTVNAPATATRAKELTVTGKLTSDAAFPSGATLTVTRTDLEFAAGKALAPVTVAADGTYSFKDTPPNGGPVTYTVSYAGDTTHESASAYDTVEVSRTATSLTLNKNGTTYAYGADVTFTAHLGTTYKNREVEIWADPYGSDKPNRLVKSGNVNSSGNLSVTLDLTRDTKLTAKFAGDLRSAPTSVTSRVYTKVQVSTTPSRHYKTKYAWNHTYYYFRKSVDPLFTTKMTYYPGREYRVEVQAYYGDAWHSGDKDYFELESDGVGAIELTGTPSTGVRFRLRSSYIDTDSGDNVNTTTHSSWKYFTFTS